MPPRRSFGLVSCLLGFGLLTGCAGGVAYDLDPGDLIPAYAYAGPGGAQRIVLATDGRFALDMAETPDKDPHTTWVGGYTRLSSGLITLHVDAAKGRDLVPAGTKLLGLEAAGLSLVLRTATGDDLMTLLVDQGCPSNDFEANVVLGQATSLPQASDPSAEWFGTFTYEHDKTSLASMPTVWNLGAFTPISVSTSSLGEFTCDQGPVEIASETGPVLRMWLSDQGALVQRFDANGVPTSVMVGLRQAQVTVKSVAGDYAGLIAGLVPGASAPASMGSAPAAPSDPSAAPPSVRAARVTLGADGQGEAFFIVDEVSGETAGERLTFTLTASNELATGLITGAFTQGSTQGHLACATRLGVPGIDKTVLLCVGQSPTDPTKPLRMFLTSRDAP